MKKIVFAVGISGLLISMSQVAYPSQNIDGLYAAWCMTGMSKKLGGKRIPDKATYTFTKDSKLKYDAGFFKQEDNFSISDDKIKTNSMGNYKIISIESNEMILNYGGYMYFTKGACK
jgi:hypothetical protein